MTECKYCNREFSNPGGLVSHQPYCKSNPDRVKRYRSPNAGPKKGTPSWIKGKKTPESVKRKISEALIGKSKGICFTEEEEAKRRFKISNTMKRNGKSGGIRKGAGIGKSGWYKGFWCDSTWELSWVIYNIEHNIEFERNKKGFEYEYKGESHRYYPDFIKEGTYYEIKGRRKYSDLNEKTKCKIEQFDKKLEVLFENDMEVYLKYTIGKYGKDFHKLYEE